MARGLISIIIGVVMVIGGLSGKLVMRGTESGGALALVGGIVLGIGVFRIIQANKNNPSGGGPAT
ncbi:MAG: hypothetical protein JNK82_23395 [Myxococcaceae bacterium]|nr:hypothetical protein [Myxococcaceae bacterium]